MRPSRTTQPAMADRLLVQVLVLCGFWFTGDVTVRGQQGTRSYPPQLPGARVEVYKTVGDVKLNLYIYEPGASAPVGGSKDEDSPSPSPRKRPAIVFFFGGGWQSGTPAQFQHQCEHLAQRGMVAITADYRVASRHGVKAVDCVRDAKSAIRWVRREAQRLGVDPDRIAAGGGSAGGHLAAATATIQAFDEPMEDLQISSVPNALVLFNPAVLLAPPSGMTERFARQLAGLESRLGVPPKDLSPGHHVRAGLPPTILFHGKNDTTVPYESVETFAESMRKAGNRCELVGYEGQGHGFFNYGRQGNEYFERTTKAMDDFLVSLKYLPPGRTAGE